MTSQEINETIGKLEGLFDKMIQLKILENESRRLKIQESQGGKKFPSGGLTEAKSNHSKHEENCSKGSMFEFMGQARKQIDG